MPRLLACVALTLLVSTALVAQPGTLDATFGDAGTLRLTPSPIAGANTVVVAPDAKLLLTGRVGNDAAVIRLSADGALDTDFGDGGYALVDLGGDDADTPESFTGIALRPDGKIVVAGPAGGQAVVAQLTPDGALDTDFAADGISLLDVDGGIQFNDLVLLPDGDVLVSGSALFENEENADAIVARIDANGLLDAAFGTDGYGRVAIATGGAFALALALQPDGKVVLGGFAEADGFFAADPFAARLNADGTLDEGFGAGGVQMLDFGTEFGVTADVLADASGRLVFAGSALDFAVQSSEFVLGRLDADGALDATFGTGGTVRTTFGVGLAQGFAVTEQADGKLVAAGAVGPDAMEADLAVARFRSDGTLDNAFGDEGLARADLAAIDIGVSVLLQPDGRIVVAGYENAEDDLPVAIEVARFENDGFPSGNEAAPTSGPLALGAFYPNPTSTGAQARYVLGTSSAVRLSIHDLLGREVAVLVDEVQAAGEHTALFDGIGLPAGLYIARLRAAGRVSTRQITRL